jgi:hypothetical protein
MVRGRVDVMKWTILWIVLRRWSFTIFTMIIGAKRFEMTSSLALETDASSHVHGKDFVNE